MAHLEDTGGSCGFKYKVGELVLVKWEDGMVYFAKIKKIDEKRSKCVVIFDDKSQDDADFRQIHSVDETTTDIICIKCKRDESDYPNEIVLCDSCGIGFHQRCHNPPIPATALELETPWTCIYCLRRTKCPYLTESLDAINTLLSDEKVAMDSEETESESKGGELSTPLTAPSPMDTMEDDAFRVSKKKQGKRSGRGRLKHKNDCGRLGSKGSTSDSKKSKALVSVGEEAPISTEFQPESTPDALGVPRKRRRGGSHIGELKKQRTSSVEAVTMSVTRVPVLVCGSEDPTPILTPTPVDVPKPPTERVCSTGETSGGLVTSVATTMLSPLEELRASINSSSHEEKRRPMKLLPPALPADPSTSSAHALLLSACTPGSMSISLPLSVATPMVSTGAFLTASRSRPATPVGPKSASTSPPFANTPPTPTHVVSPSSSSGTMHSSAAPPTTLVTSASLCVPSSTSSLLGTPADVLSPGKLGTLSAAPSSLLAGTLPGTLGRSLDMGRSPVQGQKDAVNSSSVQETAATVGSLMMPTTSVTVVTVGSSDATNKTVAPLNSPVDFEMSPKLVIASPNPSPLAATEETFIYPESSSIHPSVLSQIEAIATCTTLPSAEKQTLSSSVRPTLLPFERQSVIPSERPTLPSERPTLPSEKPTLPSERPTLPSERPTLPSERPTLPSERPSLPSEKPTLPFERPTPPFERPTLPSERPTLPSERPSLPAERPTLLPPDRQIHLPSERATASPLERSTPFSPGRQTFTPPERPSSLFDSMKHPEGDLAAKHQTRTKHPLPADSFAVDITGKEGAQASSSSSLATITATVLGARADPQPKSKPSPVALEPAVQKTSVISNVGKLNSVMTPTGLSTPTPLCASPLLMSRTSPPLSPVSHLPLMVASHSAAGSIQAPPPPPTVQGSKVAMTGGAAPLTTASILPAAMSTAPATAVPVAPTMAPPPMAPPTVAPPTVAPPTVAPPTVAPSRSNAGPSPAPITGSSSGASLDVITRTMVTNLAKPPLSYTSGTTSVAILPSSEASQRSNDDVIISGVEMKKKPSSADVKKAVPERGKDHGRGAVHGGGSSHHVVETAPFHRGHNTTAQSVVGERHRAEKSAAPDRHDNDQVVESGHSYSSSTHHHHHHHNGSNLQMMGSTMPLTSNHSGHSQLAYFTVPPEHVQAGLALQDSSGCSGRAGTSRASVQLKLQMKPDILPGLVQQSPTARPLPNGPPFSQSPSPSQGGIPLVYNLTPLESAAYVIHGHPSIQVSTYPHQGGHKSPPPYSAGHQILCNFPSSAPAAASPVVFPSQIVATTETLHHHHHRVNTPLTSTKHLPSAMRDTCTTEPASLPVMVTLSPASCDASSKQVAPTTGLPPPTAGPPPPTAGPPPPTTGPALASAHLPPLAGVAKPFLPPNSLQATGISPSKESCIPQESTSSQVTFTSVKPQMCATPCGGPTLCKAQHSSEAFDGTTGLVSKPFAVVPAHQLKGMPAEKTPGNPDESNEKASTHTSGTSRLQASTRASDTMPVTSLNRSASIERTKTSVLTAGERHTELQSENIVGTITKSIQDAFVEANEKKLIAAFEDAWKKFQANGKKYEHFEQTLRKQSQGLHSDKINQASTKTSSRSKPISTKISHSTQASCLAGPSTGSLEQPQQPMILSHVIPNSNLNQPSPALVHPMTAATPYYLVYTPQPTSHILPISNGIAQSPVDIQAQSTQILVSPSDYAMYGFSSSQPKTSHNAGVYFPSPNSQAAAGLHTQHVHRMVPKLGDQPSPSGGGVSVPISPIQNPAKQASIGTQSGVVQQFKPTSVPLPSQQGSSQKAKAKGPRVCARCGNEATYLCSGCQLEWYCGRDCQLKSWDAHSESCKV